MGGLGHFKLRLRALVLRLRNSLLLEQVFLSLQFELSVQHICLTLGKHSFGLQHHGFATFNLCFVVIRSDASQQFTALHAITFYYRQGNNLTRYIRADANFYFGLYAPGGSYNLGNITGFSIGDLYYGPLLFLTEYACCI